MLPPVVAAMLVDEAVVAAIVALLVVWLVVEAELALASVPALLADAEAQPMRRRHANDNGHIFGILFMVSPWARFGPCF